MNKPITSVDEIHKDAASEIEAQVRADAAGLSPAEIETIVALVLRFGPSMYQAILRLFHVTKKG